MFRLHIVRNDGSDARTPQDFADCKVAVDKMCKFLQVSINGGGRIFHLDEHGSERELLYNESASSWHETHGHTSRVTGLQLTS